MSQTSQHVILELRLPRESEETPEAMASAFAAFTNLKSSFWDRLLSKEAPLIFEIAAINQTIHFYAVIPKEYQTYFESQMSAQYPKMTTLISPDYLTSWSNGIVSAGQLKLAAPFYFPLKIYTDFKETDPLSSVLGTLSGAGKQENVLIQIVLVPAKGWQSSAAKIMRQGGIVTPDGQTTAHPQAKLIEQKINQPGFRCAIRLLVSSTNKISGNTLLKNLAGSFGALALGSGNALYLTKTAFWQEKKFIKSIFDRTAKYLPRNQILNSVELATIYHLPGIGLTGIKNIAWGTKLTGEPPDNLPIGTNATDEEKKEINFFGRTEFKNQLITFGIKKKDRRKHTYIIGKSGTGKSTLIANMAINDVRNGEGLAVIDPHGDLSEIMLDYVPANRINDVCYLDPSDTAHPFALNPLEVKNPEHRELVASGIVAIFKKLYQYSWGPRLEYILRNTIMTLLQKPDSTLVEVPQLLTDRAFRQKTLEKLSDPVLRNFWQREYEQMSEKMMTESISPILNKVGQFVSSPLIRGIIGQPHSSVDLEEIMNKGKILILNLSQGKLGEDNAALLGAMFITKMQLAAMNRVNITEESRKDFYLYVDEFQNFATTSFVKILSEARKYRLNLTLANQYIAQVPEEVQQAIFGNVGTLMTFLVGSEDSRILAREFAEVYSENELVSLGNFQIINKMSIDNLTTRPFYAFTLPLPRCSNQNRPKILRLSQERYTRARPQEQQVTTPPSPTPTPSTNSN